jgi:hypothetical protein
MMSHPLSTVALCPLSALVSITSFLPIMIFLANNVAAEKSILVPGGGLRSVNILPLDSMLGLKFFQTFNDQIRVKLQVVNHITRSAPDVTLDV